MKDKFQGIWHLIDWHCTIDGKFHSQPFGEDAQGVLIYTKNNMSAILMKSDRTQFEKPNLMKGTHEEKINAINGYVSYAGTYEIDGNQVIHHVNMSLLPNWIGTDLVRIFEFSDNENQLALNTIPEKTKGGRSVVNHLIWKKQREA